MASGQPFASRSYAGTKLPERSVNTNVMPFSASSFSRHRGLGNAAQGEFNGPEGQKQMQQSAPAPATNAQSHGPAQDANPLNRLTEEQREEINEAVRMSRLLQNLQFLHYTFLKREKNTNKLNQLPNTQPSKNQNQNQNQN
jgi:hypothetical protein